MKHIKFKAELIRPDCNYVRVTIIEQTHIRKEFGAKGSTSFRSNDGFTLTSSATFCNGGVNGTWVQGSSDHNEQREVTFALKVYERFKKAVEEYNETFK